jgi:invasion protein IalB
MRNLIIAVICVLLAGTTALLAALFFAGHNEVGAQDRTPPAPRAPAAPKPAPKPAPQVQAPSAAPAAPAPVRTETVTYDMWTVVCRDTLDGKSKKVCSASLTMLGEQQNKRVTLGVWLIAHNNEGALVSVVQTLQLDVGVLIGRGIELKLGEGKPRKISFFACNPKLCESAMPMDDAAIKEAIAGANGTAAVTFWRSDGAPVTINISSIKGIDKAIAAVR